MNCAELLSGISAIRKKHELIADLTGEGFNVFSILGLQARENRTHSAFIREILDPQGSHGMGDAFLCAFVRMLNRTLKHPEKWGLNGWAENRPLQGRVRTEVHVGFKSDDLTRGGRIDLVIEPHGAGRKNILIENKIYAWDQEGQLIRYRNSDENALLLYLTLNGGDASDFSKTNHAQGLSLVASEDYFPISYKTHILTWIEECVKEASERPLVRETLVQYGHLIRTLTQQNSSNLMTQEITKAILSSKESLLAYVEMSASKDSIRDTMIKAIEAKLEKIAITEGLESSRNSVDLYTNAEKRILWTDPLLETNNLEIGFGIENGKWFFGFCSIDAQKAALESESLRNLLSRFSEANLPGELAPPTAYWPASRWWPEIPPNWVWDLRMIGEFYFEKVTSTDLSSFGSISGFVGKVAILAREMKRIGHEVVEGS